MGSDARRSRSSMTAPSSPDCGDGQSLGRRGIKERSIAGDEVGNGALGLDGLVRLPLRLLRSRYNTFRDEPVEHPLGSDGQHPGDGAPSVGDHYLFTVAYAVEVST